MCSMKQIGISFFLLLSLLTMPLVAQNSSPTTYTVQAGETLYSISRAHGVTVQQLIDANPTAQDGLSIGEQLTIPESVEVATQQVRYTNYTVKRWQTLYGIAKRFDVSVEQLLQANPGLKSVSYKDIIRIPHYDTEVAEEAEAEIEEQMNPLYNVVAEPPTPHTGVKVALLLPFMLNDTVPSAKASLYLEFYEGFLLALEAHKQGGCDIEIHAYDTEASDIKVSQLLRNEELQQVDLIIAPDNEKHIDMISRFASQRAIKVVNAFSLNSNAVAQNPYLFQINTPQSDLFQGAIAEFINCFSQQHIVFLRRADATPDKQEFISQFKQELTTQQLPYIDYSYTDENTLLKLDSILQITGEMVIIPESANKTLLGTMLTPLTKLQEDKGDTISITLFGYPEWQMYTPEYINRFYSFNTYIYSRFYLNPLDEATHAFYKNYNYWYSKEPSPALPRYAVLGYDIGNYFLQALCSNGSAFDTALGELTSQSLQTDLFFERNNSGSGYVNKSLYFVHFAPSRTIYKYKLH